ncbi:MAG TPA: RibD family protein [Streptosporangiaceae bacterium]|nr:RibD family protein [Streptosporangiaceae bacterium]
MDRPYVLLSCAISIDGYLDDASDQRLVLSGPADMDRADEVRASCDAILVGAGTIRADNPRLLIRSEARREARAARGLADPLRVVLAGRGDLDPAARFFTAGQAGALVYVASPAAAAARARLAGPPADAEVVDAGSGPVDLHLVLADLAARGVGRLLVEGGRSVHTQFLAAGLADELQLVIAPFFVADSRAPRFAGDGDFPWTADRPARLAEVCQVGADVLLRFALSERFGTT